MSFPEPGPEADLPAGQRLLHPLSPAVEALVRAASADPSAVRPAQPGDRIPRGSRVLPPLGDPSLPEAQSVVVITPEKAVLEMTYAQLDAVGRKEWILHKRTQFFEIDAGFSLKRPQSPPKPAPAKQKRQRQG